jgi:hypothetical protein
MVTLVQYKISVPRRQPIANGSKATLHTYTTTNFISKTVGLLFKEQHRLPHVISLNLQTVLILSSLSFVSKTVEFDMQ